MEPCPLEVGGRWYRVAMDNQDRIVDWFEAQDFQDGCSASVDGSSAIHCRRHGWFVVRLRAPLGFAVYSFSGRVEERPHAIEIVVNDGIRMSSEYGNGKLEEKLSSPTIRWFWESVRTRCGNIPAEICRCWRSSIRRSRPRIRYWRKSRLKAFGRFCEGRYGETTNTVLAVFARWHELVHDDGVPPEDAYGQIADEFGVSEEQFKNWQRELRDLPGLGELAGPGLDGELNASASFDHLT